MRNYYVQIHEYIQMLISNIFNLDRKGIRINEFKLSFTDYLILKLLGQEGGKKMYEVMNDLNIDRNSFKTITNRLITTGYIIRNKSFEDKRAYFLELTDKGKLVFEQASKLEKELLMDLLKDFTFNEEKTILKFLVKLDMLNKDKQIFSTDEKLDNLNT